MRRIFVVSAAALCLLLAGCSSPTTSTTQDSPESEPAAAAPTPEPSEPSGDAAPTETETAAAAPVPAAAPALTTDEQKTIYALGLSISRSLRSFDLSPTEVELVKRALGDALAGTPAVDLDTWGPKIDPLARTRQTRVTQKNREASKAYLATAANAKGAVKTASGLIYKEMKGGSGNSPKASDTVRVHYKGTLVSGDEFDSSYRRGEPAEFPLDGVIPCWTEGVQKMKVGGKAQLVCPAEIAYGERDQASIPAGSTLIFEVELLDIQ